MPQLELSTYFSQFFWLILCFCILWLMLSLFITPKLSDIIEQRKRKINDYVQKADKLNMQAKEALDRYNTSLAQAEEIAEKEMQKGKDELKAYLSDAENKMTASINRKIADNEFFETKEKVCLPPPFLPFPRIPKHATENFSAFHHWGFYP